MVPSVRAPEAASQERMAAGFMAAHFLMQLFGALALGGVMLGFGGLFGVVGAVEQELPALAIGGFFGGLGVLLALFLLVQAVPAFFAMWGMWRGSSWRQAAAVIAASLALTHFPVGTLLALGTLWCTWQGHEAQKKADAR